MIKLHGAVLPKVTTYPLNPTEGLLSFVNDILYVYTDIDGFESWYPITNRTQRFSQSMSDSDTWVIPHNLNSDKLLLFCYDDTGNMIIPTNVVYDTLNQATLTFSESYSGHCVVFIDVSEQLSFLADDTDKLDGISSEQFLRSDVADTVEINESTVLSLDETLQKIGVTTNTNISVNQTSNEITGSANGEQRLLLSETEQKIGKDTHTYLRTFSNSPTFGIITGVAEGVEGLSLTSGIQTIGVTTDTNISLSQTGNTIKLKTADNTTELTASPNGISLKNGTSINEFSIDGTLADNSDDAVPTEKAVKTYIDTELEGLSVSNILNNRTYEETLSSDTDTITLTFNHGSFGTAYVDGVRQSSDSFTFSGTDQIVFDEVLPANSKIVFTQIVTDEISTIQLSNTYTETLESATDTITLDFDHEDQGIAFIDGLRQAPNSFSFSGTNQIVFSEVLPIGTVVVFTNVVYNDTTLSTDTTLSNDSDALVPTQHAVKKYVDDLVPQPSKSGDIIIVDRDAGAWVTQPYVGKNFIDNPHMTINQRSFTSGFSSHSGIASDRWYCWGASGITVGTPVTTHYDFRSQDGTMGQGALYVQNNGSGNPPYAITQNIPMCKVRSLLGQKVTLSFMCNSNKANNFSSGLFYGTSSTNQYATPQTLSVSASTWEKKIITFTVNADAYSASDLYVRLYVASGFDNINSIWDYFYVTQVKLELGENPTTFIMPEFIHELAKCQAYYESSYTYGTVRGTATYTDMTQWNATAAMGVGSWYPSPIKFKVPKFLSPTMSFWSPGTGTGGYARNLSLGSNGAITTAYVGQNECSLQSNVAGFATAANQVIGVHWEASTGY
jgi:hypothetical protein